jgi:hypothetical protein
MKRSLLVTAAQPHGIYTRFPISPNAVAKGPLQVSTASKTAVALRKNDSASE